MDSFYSASADEAAKKVETDVKNGLTSAEAGVRLQKYGANQLEQPKGKNPLLLFLSEFTDFLVLILIAAAIVSYFLGEKIDSIMIVVIVLMNAIIGFIQEYRVEKAIEHLKQMVTSTQVVYRDGKLLKIPSSELVPGDVVELEEGQKVTADIRLTSVINLQTIEAPLTGESTPVTKQIDTLSGELPVADQKNMLFSGTVISSGKGTGIVVLTGMQTQIGKIAHMVSAQEETETPMQQKLDHLGALIGKIVLGIAVIVGIEEMVFGDQHILEALLSAVALAVAAIPEGLPAVVTISLAFGTRRLLKQHALIRNLPATETLGSTDVICSDKTGTLTTGAMTVRSVYVNMHEIKLEEKTEKNEALMKLLKMGVLSSNARKSGENFIGDPTEVALIKAALDNGEDQEKIVGDYKRLQEIPFSSDRKMMTTVSESAEGKLVTSKGAVEMILAKCNRIEVDGQERALTEEDKKQILAQNEKMAGEALRVLAFAYKNTTEAKEVEEKELVFLGLQGMMDPPKQGVKESIAICQNQAGIKVVMITGDHLLTAQAVAREIGIADNAITGQDLDKISEEEFKTKVETLTVYARVNPEHKLRIVNALKANGHQVAMTGDGVNDAPALKAADIGVGMGINGTDVAKDSSDMILLDDHFATIVSAVREGRGIFENIRKFVAYLLSANAMEVMIIFFALLLGWPLPLLPIHLLWINLVTDGLPAVAIGIDPTRGDIMNAHPGEFKQDIVTGAFMKFLFVISAMTTIAILTIIGIMQHDIVHEQTMALTAVVVFEMIIIWAIRSQYKLSLFSNKYLASAVGLSLGLHLLILYLPVRIGGSTLQELFKISPLGVVDWLIILGTGAVLLILWKLVFSSSLISCMFT